MGLTSIVLRTGEKPPSFTVLYHLAITTGFKCNLNLASLSQSNIPGCMCVRERGVRVHVHMALFMSVAAKVGWLQGSACFCLPRVWVMGMCYHDWLFFLRALEIRTELRPLCLCGNILV